MQAEERSNQADLRQMMLDVFSEIVGKPIVLLSISGRGVDVGCSSLPSTFSSLQCESLCAHSLRESYEVCLGAAVAEQEPAQMTRRVACPEGMQFVLASREYAPGEFLAIAIGDFAAESEPAAAVGTSSQEECGNHLSPLVHKRHLALTDIAQSIARVLGSQRTEDYLVRQSVDDISHELQTRLQALLCAAENLQSKLKGMPDEESTAKLGDLVHSIQTASVAVHTLGDYLPQYRYQQVNVVDLVQEAARLYGSEAEQRSIAIDIRLDRGERDLLVAKASRSHLQYAINNLLQNAIKYSFQGSEHRQRRVVIDCVRIGNRIELGFSNYGVGILREEIEGGRIFEDGYRGQLTEGEYRLGAGRGLGLVARVVKRHQGGIGVESRPARDNAPHGPYLTRITISIPCWGP